MNKDFDPENTHQQNVKVAIDKILGEPTNIKKRKKTENDHKRILFKKIIESIIDAEQKTSMLEEMFMLDLNKFNNIFFEIIENFFEFNFNKEQVKVINFYLYDRYSADGAVLDLTDAEDRVVRLNSSEDLWNVIKSLENEPK